MQPLTRFAYITLLTGLLAVCTPSQAQSQPSDSHRQAAKDVYMLIGGTKAAQNAADAMISAMAANNPGATAYREIVSKWCTKVFSTDEFENDMLSIYTKHFSEKELRELLNFYKTDLGQKMITTFPIVMKEGAEIGIRHGQRHQQELLQMLSAASPAPN